MGAISSIGFSLSTLQSHLSMSHNTEKNILIVWAAGTLVVAVCKKCSLKCISLVDIRFHTGKECFITGGVHVHDAGDIDLFDLAGLGGG